MGMASLPNFQHRCAALRNAVGDEIIKMTLIDDIKYAFVKIPEWITCDR